MRLARCSIWMVCGEEMTVSNAAPRLWVRRHSLVVRLTHWINVLCLTALLMSGLQIFNATPALYWGQASDFAHPLLSLNAVENPNGTPVGVTELFGLHIPTTGLLGLSNVEGHPTARGFPAWATLPGPQWLAMGRRWHFFFAWVFVVNGLVYLLHGLLTDHFGRDLLPDGAQLRHIGTTFREHLRLHFPKGDEARHYNVLQKLAYLAVIFILLPVMVLAGLAMSPGLDSALPLVSLFGGRQSARTVHFIIAFLLLGFVVLHVAMVVLSGLWNNLRSMITGRYRIDPVEGPDA
jgi:thiosulfate reductase cytochrome b subunit